MKTIILLDEPNIAAARGPLQAISEADMVIDVDGAVIKCKGDGPERINIRELRRVLETNARLRKAGDEK